MRMLARGAEPITKSIISWVGISQLNLVSEIIVQHSLSYYIHQLGSGRLRHLGDEVTENEIKQFLQSYHYAATVFEKRKSCLLPLQKSVAMISRVFLVHDQLCFLGVPFFFLPL